MEPKELYLVDYWPEDMYPLPLTNQRHQPNKSDLCSLPVQWLPEEEATKTVVKKCVDLGPLAWKKLQSPGK
jgi:hypothetical protein